MERPGTVVYLRDIFHNVCQNTRLLLRDVLIVHVATNSTQRSPPPVEDDGDHLPRYRNLGIGIPWGIIHRQCYATPVRNRASHRPSAEYSEGPEFIIRSSVLLTFSIARHRLSCPPFATSMVKHLLMCVDVFYNLYVHLITFA
jgi:hypothetical protein